MAYGYPTGLLGGMPQTTATPPLAPQGGLLGGGPGMSTQQKRGLLAGIDPRTFGMLLLAGAQNPNWGEAFSQALLGGRQAFQQQEQDAYERKRQEGADRLMREYREAQIESQRAEIEAAKREAELAATEAAKTESGIAAMRTDLMQAGVPNAGLMPAEQLEDAYKEFMKLKVQQMFPKEEGPALRSVSPGQTLLQVGPDGATPIFTAPDRPRAARPPAQPAENPMLEYVRGRVDNIVKDGKGQITPEQAAAFAVREWQAAQSAVPAEPGGSPAGSAPSSAQSPESILEAAGVPPAKRTPEAVAWVRAQLKQATADQIIALLRGQ